MSRLRFKFGPALPLAILTIAAWSFVFIVAKGCTA
jgi:hypothetical protein